MKRTLTILGVALVLLVPAAFAFAAAPDGTPVVEQNSFGDGAGNTYEYQYGEPQTVRVQEAVQTQTGSRWGDGPMGSDEAPYGFGGFGPGECTGECDGPHGPNATGEGPYGPGECTGECEGPYGPNYGAETPYGPYSEDGGASYGPGEAVGPQDGTGPIQEGPQDGSGNQFGPGPGGNTSASPGGSAHQNGTGPGGGK